MQVKHLSLNRNLVSTCRHWAVLASVAAVRQFVMAG